MLAYAQLKFAPF